MTGRDHWRDCRTIVRYIRAENVGLDSAMFMRWEDRVDNEVWEVEMTWFEKDGLRSKVQEVVCTGSVGACARVMALAESGKSPWFDNRKPYRMELRRVKQEGASA